MANFLAAPAPDFFSSGIRLLFFFKRLQLLIFFQAAPAPGIFFRAAPAPDYWLRVTMYNFLMILSSGRTEEPANFLAAPAPDIFSNRLRLLFFSSDSGAKKSDSGSQAAGN